MVSSYSQNGSSICPYFICKFLNSDHQESICLYSTLQPFLLNDFYGQSRSFGMSRSDSGCQVLPFKNLYKIPKRISLQYKSLLAFKETEQYYKLLQGSESQNCIHNHNSSSIPPSPKDVRVQYI